MRYLYGLLALLFIGMMAFSANHVDVDTWFLLNSGRFVATEGFPHVEPFTVHEGFHFVMQQWLYALGLWKLYSLTGLIGLFVFPWVAGAAILFCYARLMLRVTEGNVEVSCLLTGVVLFFACPYFFCQRPQMASTLIFLVEIGLLERYASAARMPRFLPAIFFVLSVLLVNLHAAMWPMLLVFLLPYAAESLLGGRLPFSRQTFHWCGREFLLLALIILAGGFLDPYGTEAMTYSLHGYGYAEINQLVLEMHPLSFERPMYGVPLLLVIIGLSLYARRALPLRYQLLALGTGFLALQALRSLLLFLLFGTLGIGYLFRKWHERKQAASFPRLRNLSILIFLLILCRHGWALFFASVSPLRRELFVLSFLLLLGVVLAAARTLYHRRHEACLDAYGRRLLTALLAFFLVPFTVLSMEAPYIIPAPVERAAAMLAAQALPEDSRVYAEYNAGGYLGFRGYRYYIDSRAEVYLPALNHRENILREYADIKMGRIAPQVLQEKYAFTHYLVEEEDDLYEALADNPDYVLLYDSKEDNTILAAAQQSEAAVRLYVYRHK